MSELSARVKCLVCFAAPVVFFSRQVFSKLFPNHYNFFFPSPQSVKVPTNILTKGDVYSFSLKPFNVHSEQYRIRTFMEMAFFKNDSL